MKILLAINVDRPELANDRAVRWASRTGFEVRIFGAKDIYNKLVNMVNDVNYNFYVNLRHDQIITKMSAMEYALEHDFDLLFTVPQGLWSWRKGRQFKPDEVFYAREAAGKARLEFGVKHRMNIKRWANGAVMERVHKDGI